MRNGVVTVKPDTREGHFVLLNDLGDPVGVGMARPSSVVGYVTLVVLSSGGLLDGLALRVPADWVAELGKVAS